MSTLLKPPLPRLLPALTKCMDTLTAGPPAPLNLAASADMSSACMHACIHSTSLLALQRVSAAYGEENGKG